MLCIAGEMGRRRQPASLFKILLWNAGTPTVKLQWVVLKAPNCLNSCSMGRLSFTFSRSGGTRFHAIVVGQTFGTGKPFVHGPSLIVPKLTLSRQACGDCVDLTPW
jgi:hypothetical protein